MKTSNWTNVLSATVLLLAIGARAQDAPTTAPAKAATSRPSGARLEKPYSEMTDLSEDQKAQIAAIHKKANEDVKAIHEKEADDIRAVLTDDQKAELDKLLAEKREKAQEKAKQKKAAATQAAAG